MRQADLPSCRKSPSFVMDVKMREEIGHNSPKMDQTMMVVLVGTICGMRIYLFTDATASLPYCFVARMFV